MGVNVYVNHEKTVLSLKLSAMSGIKWTTVSQLGRQAMQFVTTAVLARLLSPTDFGLIGMATIVIGFVSIFKDLGTTSAIIQRKELTSSLQSSIFWVNVFFGLAMSVGLLLIAPVIALFYNEALVTPLLQVLACSFLISGLSNVHQALLERAMVFDRLAKLELVATIFGALVGLGAAYLGFGVWSLVMQALTAATFTTLLLWIACPWRPQLVVKWHDISSIASYSGNLSGFSIFNYFIRNADNILIGRFLGAQDLGYYTLAYRIMLYPIQSITAVVGRVMFPAFSKIQDDDERFRAVYLKVASSIALVSFPLMLGLEALVEPFVSSVLGRQWQPVSTLLLVLTPLGMLQSIGATVGVIYQVKGRTDLLFRWGVFAGVLAVASFGLGLRWGIVGVACAYTIFSVLITYPSFYIPFRLIGLSVGDFIKPLCAPLACSVVMSLAVYGAYLLLANSLNTAMVLALLVPLGAIMYVALNWWFNREQLHQIYQAVRSQ